MRKDTSGLEPFFVDGVDVPFFRFDEGGFECIYFDTSSEASPVPMITAFAGLSLLATNSQKLIMINHINPIGLLNRISHMYDIETEDNGTLIRIEFRLKS